MSEPNTPKGKTVKEWLNARLGLIADIYDADERPGGLFLHHRQPGPDAEYWGVRVKHPDTSESDLFTTDDAGELEAFIRGVELAERNAFETKLGEDNE